MLVPFQALFIAGYCQSFWMRLAGREAHGTPPIHTCVFLQMSLEKFGVLPSSAGIMKVLQSRPLPAEQTPPAGVVQAPPFAVQASPVAMCDGSSAAERLQPSMNILPSPDPSDDAPTLYNITLLAT